jgi:chromosome segregation ATPase
MQKFAAFAASAGELAASAGELLEKADKRAGEVTEKVKERAGLPTPSRAAREDNDEGVFVPVSSAAASLLDEAERGLWLRQPGRPAPTAEASATPSRETPALQDAGEAVEEEGGGASGQAEGEPAEAAEVDEWVQQRKARQGEWAALQQELQILTMHGKKLQARLTACAAQLTQARQAEQQLRRQLQESEGGRRAAEEPLREAELRARRAEEALGGEGAQGERLRADLAAAAAEAAQAKAALALQEHSLAAVRQEQLSDERSARGVAGALGERLQATEAREEAIRRSQQELAGALGERTRELEERSGAAARAEAALARLEGSLARETALREGAAAAEARLREQAEALKAEAQAACRECEEAEAARGAAERQLAQARQEAREAEEAAAARFAREQSRAAGRASGGSEAAAAAAAQLGEKVRQVETLMSERAALRVQLEAEQGRRKGLERAAAQRAADAPMRIDVPAGEERPLRRGGEGTRLRPFTRLVTAKVPAPAPALLQAAEVGDDLAHLLDLATLHAGRFLRRHHAVRLGLGAYTLLLHVWLFVVIMHMVPEHRNHHSHTNGPTPQDLRP